MNPRRNEFYFDLPLSLHEEFAPYASLWGRFATGVVATEGSVESLRGRMGESTRQVEGLFESVLSESFEGE